MFETIIQETHLDIFGHVNNAKYLELFEQARWSKITQKGFGLDKIKETQLGPVILELNLKYLKELIHREKISITVELVHMSGKVGQLKQQMIKENGDIAAELMVTFGLFDLKNRKLVLPTDEWVKALN